MAEEQGAQIGDMVRRQTVRLLEECHFKRSTEGESEGLREGRCGAYSIGFVACPRHEPHLVALMKELREKFREARREGSREVLPTVMDPTTQENVQADPNIQVNLQETQAFVEETQAHVEETQAHVEETAVVDP